MTPIEPFEVTGQTYVERIGPPCIFDAAVGKLLAGYAFLAAGLAKAGVALSRCSGDAPPGEERHSRLLHALDLFESAWREQIQLGLIDAEEFGPASPETWLDDLRRGCRLVELIYETVMTALSQNLLWTGTVPDTAVAPLATLIRGGKTPAPCLMPGELLDVYEYALTLLTEVDDAVVCCAPRRGELPIPDPFPGNGAMHNERMTPRDEIVPRPKEYERERDPIVWVASQIRATASAGGDSVFVQVERNATSECVHLEVESDAIVDNLDAAAPRRIAFLTLSDPHLLGPLARALKGIADLAARQWTPRNSS